MYIYIQLYIVIYIYMILQLYTHIFLWYIYIFIISPPISWDVSKGDVHKNSFDPLGKKSEGDGYLYVRPLPGPKQAP